MRWLPWVVLFALACRKGRPDDVVESGPTETATETEDTSGAAPVAVADAVTASEDAAILVDVLANDTDPGGGALTVTAVIDDATIGTVTLDAGAITYAPSAQALGDGETATDAFDYEVTGPGGTSTATVTVTVTGSDDAPVAVADTASVNERGTVTGDLLANDTDVEGDPLTAALFAGPARGTVTVDAAGTFTYTHTGDAPGTDVFVYTASDGALTSVATVTVTIGPVDDPPVAVDDAAEATEDAPVTVAVLANDTDPEDGALTVVSVGAAATGAASLAGGVVTYDPNGAFEALDDGETATDTFTYTLTDGATEASATVTMTVRGRNDAPAAVADALTVPEGGTVAVNAATGLLSNDTDVDGDTLTAALTAAPTRGTATVAASGAFTYTHDGSETTSDALTYAVSDGAASDGGTLTVTVTPVNDPPVAVDDTATATEDAGVTVSVLANDTDAEGQPLSLVSVTATGLLGTATRQGDQVRWEPAGRFDALGVGDGALETFTVTVTDGTTPVTSTVRVTVQGANDAPVARPDAAVVAEGGSTGGNALDNDTDVDGDALIAALATGPTHGQVTVGADGTWTYVHDGSEGSTDSFTYTAGDGTTTRTATVSLTVTAVNDAPVLLLDGAAPDVAVDGLTGEPLPVAPALTVTDADDTVLRGATVTLVGEPGEALTASPGGTGLTTLWDAASSTLLVAGTAPVADWEAVLRGVTLITAPHAPTADDRVVTFTVTDGDDDAIAVATVAYTDPDCPDVKVSCRVWHDGCDATADAVYAIDPDGDGPNAPFDVWCDMTRHGGGWALVGHIGESGVASDDFTADLDGASLATTPVPTGAAYRHLDLDRFDAWGTGWTIRSAVDVNNGGTQFQYAFFRAAAGQSTTPGPVGQDWGASPVEGTLEYQNRTDITGTWNTTWLPVSGCDTGHCNAPIDLFTTRDGGTGASCLAGGETRHCHSIPAGLSNIGGTMTAANGMEDGVGHTWGRRGTYWIRDGRETGTVGSDTVVLMHFDGDLTDDSGVTHPITAFGDATATGTGKFGGALSLDGDGDYVRITNASGELDLSTGAWAVDFWAAWDEPNRAYQQLFNMGGDFHTEIEYGEPAGALAFSVSSNGSSWLNGGFGSFAAVIAGTGVWHHVALQRIGTSIVLFFDGAPITSFTTSGAMIPSPQVYVGYGFGGRYFHGRIDELRVTRGARFAPGGFTPPTAPYTE